MFIFCLKVTDTLNWELSLKMIHSNHKPTAYEGIKFPDEKDPGPDIRRRDSGRGFSGSCKGFLCLPCISSQKAWFYPELKFLRVCIVRF